MSRGSAFIEGLRVFTFEMANAPVKWLPASSRQEQTQSLLRSLAAVERQESFCGPAAT